MKIEVDHLVKLAESAYRTTYKATLLSRDRKTGLCDEGLGEVSDAAMRALAEVYMLRNIVERQT